MLVVIDTSVWISTLGAKHKNSMFSIVDFAKQKKISFISCQETWGEFTNVLSRSKIQKWLLIQNPNYVDFVDTIKALVVMKNVDLSSINLNHPNYKKLQNRDEKDLKFLYLSQHQKVDILITQDKDLLDLGTHNQTKIMKPNDALLLIQETLGNIENVQ